MKDFYSVRACHGWRSHAAALLHRRACRGWRCCTAALRLPCPAPPPGIVQSTCVTLCAKRYAALLRAHPRGCPAPVFQLLSGALACSASELLWGRVTPAPCREEPRALPAAARRHVIDLYLYPSDSTADSDWEHWPGTVWRAEGERRAVRGLCSAEAGGAVGPEDTPSHLLCGHLWQVLRRESMPAGQREDTNVQTWSEHEGGLTSIWPGMLPVHAACGRMPSPRLGSGVGGERELLLLCPNRRPLHHTGKV